MDERAEGFTRMLGPRSSGGVGNSGEIYRTDRFVMSSGARVGEHYSLRTIVRFMTSPASKPDELTITDMERHPPAIDPPRGKDYERELTRLQIEMLKMQLWAKETDARVLILFEGRDAAGKGGSIRRFTEHPNPRGARVVALPKPTETELTPVVLPAVREAPPVGRRDRVLRPVVVQPRRRRSRDGILHRGAVRVVLPPAPGVRAAPRRLGDPPVQAVVHRVEAGAEATVQRSTRRPAQAVEALAEGRARRQKFAQYGRARDEMLRRTDTPHAPWTVINSNEKKWARLESIRHVLHELPYSTRTTMWSTPPSRSSCDRLRRWGSRSIRRE